MYKMIQDLKPIAKIPTDLHESLWCCFYDDNVEICFWTEDRAHGKAELNLYLSSDQITVLNEHGISDELIDWMHDNNMFTIERTTNEDHVEDSYESFLITNEIVARFQAQEAQVNESTIYDYHTLDEV